MNLRILTAIALFTAPVLGVGTSRWTHTSEADFSTGQMDGVVASNLGDLKLSRSVRSILPPDARISAVYALAEAPNGVLYAGTGPRGVLLAIQGDRVTDAAEFGEGTHLFALRFDREGRLLVGTGGEHGRVYRIDRPGAQPELIFESDQVQYVWSIHPTPEDGVVYLATGPNGQLWAIDPDGAPRLVHDSDENNLLCVTGPAEGGDLLYVGTDPNGLVLRVNRRTGEVFVVYDAPETEVGALAFDDHGRLLAATSQATPDAEFQAAVAGEQTGRPDGGTGGVPIEAVPPENPTPPQLPDPPPGEPRPIPKFSIDDPQRPAQIEDSPDPADDSDEPAPATTGPTIPPTGRAAAAALEPAGDGNAIYRIDEDGFVTELFRANASFLALLTQGDSILAGSGGEGLLFQVRPSVEEILTLARIDRRQILALHASSDGGRVYLGSANRGDVLTMTAGFAPTGRYTSTVLDAGQIGRFGQVRLSGALPTGTSLTLSTRSGNVADPDGAGWSAWSDPAPAVEFLPVTSPPARFLQYRLSFTADAMAAATPVVREVEIAYQIPNRAPVVSAVRVVPGDAADPNTRARRVISWESSDPNLDALRFSVQFRPVGSAGEGGWITIQDDLDETTYDWDTRTVSDGRYELRVIASDASANPEGAGLKGSRVSEPVVVDNSPPVIGDVTITPLADAPGAVQVRCVVVDRGSTVAKLEYAVDGHDQWQLALPSDKIADSPKEAYAFVLRRRPGPGVIALRATDSSGNQGFVSVPVPAVAAERD